ncbi:MAG: arylsulfotransferase family protein [Myxococcales bacterium]|nr:arylsulfotransferase family protein [Myxococcales bacterium]
MPMRFLIVLVGCSTSTPPSDPDDPLPRVDTATTPTTLTTEPPEVNGLQLHDDVVTVVWAGWKQPDDAQSTWVTWEVDGVELSTPATARAAGSHTVPLLGTPADTEISPVLHTVTKDVESTTALGTITTGSLPPSLPPGVLTHSDPDQTRPERWLLTTLDPGKSAFLGPWYTLILDAQGRIVWYLQTSDSRMTWQASPSTGHLLLDENGTYTFDGDDALRRITLDLTQQQIIDVPLLSIAFDEMPDGGFVYGFGDSTSDYGIRRLHPDGTDELIWTCNPWMAKWTTGFWSCNANTVTFHPDRNSVLYSMFETNTVVEIDLDEGTILRELGQYPGGYTTLPATAQLDHQHLPTWTPEGTLFTQTDSPSKPGQWVREYQLREDSQIMEPIFSLESNHFAQWGGHAQRLPSGHILWAHGTGAAIEELTPTGEIVWAVDYESGVLGNAIPIADLYALNQGI